MCISQRNYVNLINLFDLFHTNLLCFIQIERITSFLLQNQYRANNQELCQKKKVTTFHIQLFKSYFYSCIHTAFYIGVCSQLPLMAVFL